MKGLIFLHYTPAFITNPWWQYLCFISLHLKRLHSLPESAEPVSLADSECSVGAQTAGAYITPRLFILSVTQRGNADPAAPVFKRFRWLNHLLIVSPRARVENTARA